MQDPDLWHRIETYDFPKGFEENLATRFGGSTRTARILRDEYRRFVYLAVIAPKEVTPSEQIDYVWHVHLTYTRDYWENFCKNVIGQDLHHNPSDGPESLPRYRDQYAETLFLYEKEFNEQPPEQVWPTGKYLRNFYVGGAVTVLGITCGLLAISLGENVSLSLLIFSLFLLIGGGTYALWSFPYKRSPANKVGCGGGGCGG
jgi:hypothetical protein